ncbi:hypothetical protein B0H14DRAFT_634921 [Mycena olivaceomarginata]|nr:hypothetical protein B0H14DRAFT_634921 [Mycena olivaceomarginata]
MLVYPPHYECHRQQHGLQTRRPHAPVPQVLEQVRAPVRRRARLRARRPRLRLRPPLQLDDVPAAPAAAVRPARSPGRAFLSPAPDLPACAAAPVSASYPPPAPVLVYAPGDVRMGGAPCWRCGGRGTLSFLVFDSVPCVVCRGVGRGVSVVWCREKEETRMGRAAYIGRRRGMMQTELQLPTPLLPHALPAQCISCSSACS